MICVPEFISLMSRKINIGFHFKQDGVGLYLLPSPKKYYKPGKNVRDTERYGP